MKYDEDEEGRAVRKADADEMLTKLEYDGLNPTSPIHLPAPSYFPFVMALGFPLMFYGIIYHTTMLGKALIAIGAIIALSAVIGWAIEPLEEPMEHHELDSGNHSGGVVIETADFLSDQSAGEEVRPDE
jgi:cytochrome c oxidase subunit 1